MDQLTERAVYGPIKRDQEGFHGEERAKTRLKHFI